MPPETPLLELRGLTVDYRTVRARVRAVDGVSVDLARGEVLGLVGESGSGKSTVAQAVLRLLDPAAAAVTGGIFFEGRDVLAMKPDELRAFRWKRASLVLQSAMSALNPVLTVGEQIADVFEAHAGLTRRAGLARARALLERVGIQGDRLSSYPHQLSGGMRQRVVIALALALDPPLVILDEPTTALDVVVQREVLRQVAALRAERGFSMLFITHDLALMGELATRVGVMYAGELVELAPTRDLLAEPRHPYSRALMGSFPSLTGPRVRLAGIPGSPPDLARPPAGCRFHPRCAQAMDRCASDVPAARPLPGARRVACHLY